MEDLKISLGQRDYYISPTKFSGQILIHLRSYMRNSRGELVPQKKGISLKLDEWNDLLKSLPVVERQISKLQIEKQEGEVEQYIPTVTTTPEYSQGFTTAASQGFEFPPLDFATSVGDNKTYPPSDNNRKRTKKSNQ